MQPINFLYKKIIRARNRFFFHAKEYQKLLKLWTIADFFQYFNLHYQRKFKTKKQIFKAKKKMSGLVFNNNKYITEFENAGYELEIMPFFGWKEKVNNLNKKQKYFIVGVWQEQMEFYRFIKMKKFKVYLIKNLS